MKHLTLTLILFSALISHIRAQSQIGVAFQSNYLGNNLAITFGKERENHRFDHEFQLLFQINKRVDPNTIGYDKAMYSKEFTDPWGIGYDIRYRFLKKENLIIKASLSNKFFYTKFKMEDFAPYGQVELDSSGTLYDLAVLIKHETENILSLQTALGLRFEYKATENMVIHNTFNLSVAMLYDRQRFYAPIYVEVASGLAPSYSFGISYML